jgi:protein-disulfide isomerase
MPRRWVPLLVLGLIGAAILAAIVSISVGEKGPAPPVEGSEAAQRLYGGIEQQGDSLGSPDAPVTISIFNDLQCTDCADYHLGTVPELVERLVRPGEARLEFRHFSIGPRQTTAAALAATAAGEQGAEWQYAHLVFLNVDDVRVGGVTPRFLRRVAAAVPGPQFDEERWSDDLESPQVEARVQSDAELATELRLPAMPAVVVDGPGGTRELDEAPSLARIEAAVEEVGEG